MENIRRQLIRHEGLRLRPYKCSAGKITIGVGRNIEDRGITEAEAMVMLKNDIAGARADVDSLLDEFGIRKWELNQARLDALTNMAFNLGRKRLSGFKKMIAAIKDRNFDLAAAEMLNSKYARDVGQRAVELSNQLFSGKYQDQRG
ncbi:lysozyme [Desulfosarcina variabilis str. Montpellier]|uniref:glycoside hydrolase family protein n=1 Tax=Desulfosarcina variabilis TaxID=2300 RepID=UPI003AFB6094